MTPAARRDAVRALLLDRARRDARITGAALTGSAARGTEDRWSDIDLFLGLAPDVPVASLLADWTAYLYGELGALHHFDLRAGEATYRAFLLPEPEPLEVDLGLAPGSAFGPVGDGGFRTVFGTPVAARPGPVPDTGHLTGLAWHHVLHARIAVERGALWNAEHWISAVRDHVLTLACARLGLPTAYAKGADRLPPGVTAPLEATLVRALDRAELTRALGATVDALLGELEHSAPEAAGRLRTCLLALANGGGGGGGDGGRGRDDRDGQAGRGR
ncbi:nucleotidyltransferase domain-containing protein [Streptomyces avicenniae]|uniref:nucleotidyltransferase domain-containing protein n=1 Tax=Streptomyces avicenniae TaxID=500153 RepID=UPI000A9651D7|nr:nucleotidyltransferase domain-containing protein [Streptomyces avicenniae]